MPRVFACAAVLAGCAWGHPQGLGAAPPEVKLWETSQVIPTYQVAPPDLNPRFDAGRTYQGARATFYPYPVSDRLTDVREDRPYKTVFLENQYVQLSVLPELGGRIFSALDKSNQYDFFYRQHVIKPALIGMLGAWISGGVEWNVPHHHRASSFMPVDYTLQENADGSKTVWVGETELRHRLRWIVGLTLHPDRSYIEMSVRVFNRTPLAHSLLFWINPAVHANQDYQVIFPPDADFAVQHGKPEFAHWPIARETYGGTDYSRGVDISWWKNHPSPVSFFCFQSNEDFFGGYDHGRQAGVLHVANHHLVPGKKFFEWGVGTEGDMWSQILTDSDGPYLELMAGAYSDNQPDYSWIQPGEVKSWKHYWYPIRQMGGVKQANLDAAVNLEVTNRLLKLAFNATTEFRDAKARVLLNDKSIFDRTITVGPTRPFAADALLEQDIPAAQLRAVLLAADGRELVSYRPVVKADRPLPPPVKRPQPPKSIPSAEELYLTGLRVEQLYSPAFEAAPYYEEALQRDPGDYRANTALGILLCKQWRWEEAVKRLEAAVERATNNYIRPKDGEALYYLGVALRAQGRLDAACDAFYRAAWGQAWQAPAYLALAEIDSHRQRYSQALELVDRSLAASAMNTKSLNLKAGLMRHTGRPEIAERLGAAAQGVDPLDHRAAFEIALAQRQKGETNQAARTLARWRQSMRGEAQAGLELATDYANAGFWPEATEVLQDQVENTPNKARVYPLVYYYLGHYLEQMGRPEATQQFYRLGAQMPTDYCFPLRSEEEAILRQVTRRNPQDPRAPYYLGNLLYDRQPQQAILAWETARQLDESLALVHRNLALAYAQTESDIPKATASLERAVALQPKEPRFLYELDVLYEAGGIPVAKRLDSLTRHHETAAQRDDALTREIVLLTVAGEAERAVQLVTQRRFHNWEGRGEIHGIYADAWLRRGLGHLRAGRSAAALKDFSAALEYPANLEVGRPRRDRKTAQVHYFIAAAHQAANNSDQAQLYLGKVLDSKERSASELQFYQGLAHQKLGQNEEARRIFEGLIRQGQNDLSAAESVDYFAKFGERQSGRVRRAQAQYLIGLGHSGLGQRSEAGAAFRAALELHPAHLGATLWQAGDML